MNKQTEKAAQTLRREGNRKVLGFYRLRDIVQALPAPAEWDEWATFHIFATTDFRDGNEPSVSTLASFSGCDLALETAALLLCASRSLRAAHERSSKIKVTHQLVLAVGNTVNSARAWLDCETGELKTGKAWPAADVVAKELNLEDATR